jgi:16S rRNA U516 pseudouridylate synthase RsuA-like enzyme
MPEMVRIQKLLSSWGVASRRTIEKWIDEGRIKVNGATLSEQGLLLNPEADLRIEVDGKQIKRPAAAEFAIYCFNKPAGVVTTLDDELGRKTIKDYLPKDRRLYPIGRLDYDSTGLLLVTDHGELTHRLLHPSFKVEKEYIVRIKSQEIGRASCRERVLRLV